MDHITVFRAAELCGGAVIGPESNQKTQECFLRQIVIDSRAVQPGDLFAAYRGERVDGHDYIAAAFRQGAACCLAERIPENAPEKLSGPLILVPDVQQALEKLAKAYRSQFQLPLIGITGSVGKTTAKEMVAAVLSRRFRTLKTEGNLNNQIGVPMMLSRLRTEHEAAVIEMGISDFGEMRLLADMARPTAAVFTVIGHAHLEFLHDLDGVLKAKTELLEYLPEDAPVIVNGDDEKLRSLRCGQQKILYGLGEHNDIRAENIAPDGDGIACDIVADRWWRSASAAFPESVRIPVRIPAFGQHHVYAALAAAAVGMLHGLTQADIAEGIADFRNVGRRGELVQTALVTMIDDSYNANPDSVKSGIDSLMQLPGKRHICILGDMLELGEESGDMHADVGSYAAEKGADLVLTAGSFGPDTARGAGQIGRYYVNRDALISALRHILQEGDCVLVKASKGSHFETVSAAIRSMAEHYPLKDNMIGFPADNQTTKPAGTASDGKVMD